MTRAVARVVTDEAGAAAVACERRGLVAEAADGTGSFSLADGPLRSYHRRVGTRALDGGRVEVTQVVDFTVGLPFVSWLFILPLRHHLGRIRPRRGLPWWAPPVLLPRRAAVALCTLCALEVGVGFLGDLLPATMTYAGRQDHVGSTGQGIALGVAQIGAVAALGVLAVADRRGRRPVLLATAVLGALVSAAGAGAGSVWLLTASQVVAGALVGAAAVLIGVLVVEEMPAGARAWSIGVVGMCSGLGSGITLAVLPLADDGPGGWRWIFVLSLAVVPGVALCAPHLTESVRFVRADRRDRPGGAGSPGDGRRPGGRGRLTGEHRRMLLLLGAGTLLFALFDTPAGQLQHQYLRTERHFSALHISVLEQVVGTIGGLGTLIGGRLADTKGRRPVVVVGVVAGVVVTLAGYLTTGVALAGVLTVRSLLSYGVGPALAIYGGELFPTRLRSRAGGVLTVLGAAGGLVGLVTAGALTDAFGTVAPALAVLAVGPLALAVLVVVAYPETAGRQLEELNPVDAPSTVSRPAAAVRPGPPGTSGGGGLRSARRWRSPPDRRRS